MRKFCGIAIIVGVLLFLLGTSMKHETEVRTYHEVYKDYSGTWQGRDVSYLGDKSNGLEMTGLVVAIAGGVGLYIVKKIDK